jgi:NADPH:quinone reductase-like Zn-dependent oxidoreductase
MKKIIFNNPGIPEKILELIDSEIPTPQTGEVLVKVKASPINPSDIAFINGVYGIRPSLPSGAGFEGAGTVAAIGAEVALPIDSKVSFTSIEAWGEYVIVPAKAVMLLPETMPFEVGCQVFVNPLTAWAMVHESGLSAGDWLVLTAGGSTFAQLVVQIASKKGIQTICTVRRNDQIDQLKALGATEVVNTESTNLVKRVRELTDKKGANACFDATGGDLTAQALQSLGYKGLMFVYGMLSQKDTPINNGIMIFKSLTIKGFWLTTWLQEADKEARKQAGIEVIAMLNSGELKVTIDATYALNQYKEAVIHAQGEGRTGKILIMP